MMLRIVKYVAGDILRGRIVLAYAGFLLVASLGLFNLGGDTAKALIGLLSLVLMIVPLVSLVFATAHFYNAQEFVELLAAQPLPRTTILLAQIIGVTLALNAALLVGIAVPVLLVGLACALTWALAIAWLLRRTPMRRSQAAPSFASLRRAPRRSGVRRSRRSRRRVMPAARRRRTLQRRNSPRRRRRRRCTSSRRRRRSSWPCP